ncbi:MAG: glycosyltransferase [Acidobacteriota bacterium]
MARVGIQPTVLLAKPWLPDALAQRLPKYRHLWKLPERETRDGIDIFFARYLHIPQYRRPQATVRACCRALWRTLKRHGLTAAFDVIHAQGAWPVGLAAPKLARVLATPFLTTLHIQDDSQLYERPAGRKLYREMLRSTDTMITVGSPMDQFLDELAFTGRRARIPNGIDPRKIQAAIHAAGSAPPPARDWGHVISVSNLWPTKGVACNLLALARLDAAIWQSYTIVGEGPERQSLERLARDLGIAERVVFTGRLSNHEALQHIARADIFALPSWQEAFGVVYLEAMACGKPVIGCRGQGAQDIFDHERQGLLVEPPSAEDKEPLDQEPLDQEPLVASLTDALERLLTDSSAAREMGEAGRERARELTWDTNAERTSALYRQAIERAKPASSPAEAVV